MCTFWTTARATADLPRPREPVADRHERLQQSISDEGCLVINDNVAANEAVSSYLTLVVRVRNASHLGPAGSAVPATASAQGPDHAEMEMKTNIASYSKCVLIEVVVGRVGVGLWSGASCQLDFAAGLGDNGVR